MRERGRFRVFIDGGKKRFCSQNKRENDKSEVEKKRHMH
jgi:hypothetical protein